MLACYCLTLLLIYCVRFGQKSSRNQKRLTYFMQAKQIFSEPDICQFAIYDEIYHVQFLDGMLKHLPCCLCHYMRKGHPINDVMIFSCLLDPFFLPTPLLTVCILGVSPNFEITVACGLRFSWCLWILSLKFQNAMTKCLAETANRAETGKLQFCLLQSLEF